eukprot:9151708-Pyramimonas_sp.AAC.1
MAFVTSVRASAHDSGGRTSTMNGAGGARCARDPAKAKRPPGRKPRQGSREAERHRMAGPQVHHRQTLMARLGAARPSDGGPIATPARVDLPRGLGLRPGQLPVPRRPVRLLHLR